MITGVFILGYDSENIVTFSNSPFCQDFGNFFAKASENFMIIALKFLGYSFCGTLVKNYNNPH